jgi:hypothetical protein
MWNWYRFSPSTSGFAYQFSFHRLIHTHHPSSGEGTIGPVSGLRSKLTQSHPTPRIRLDPTFSHRWLCWMLPSGKYRHVARYKFTNVSEKILFTSSRFTCYYLLLPVYLLLLHFNPEDEESMFPWNVGELLPDCTALHPRRQRSWRVYFCGNTSKNLQIGLDCRMKIQKSARKRGNCYSESVLTLTLRYELLVRVPPGDNWYHVTISGTEPARGIWPCNRVDSSSGYGLYLYAEGAQFESRTGHQPSWKVSRGFLLALQENAGTALRSLLHVTIHLSPHHSTLYTIQQAPFNSPQINMATFEDKGALGRLRRR